MNIIEAMHDEELFAPWFKDARTWTAWESVLKAIFHIPMSPPERRVFKAITGRSRVPSKEIDESFWIVGRRGGKSFIVSLIAAYLAAFRDYREFLAPGEVATVMILAADRKQARVCIRYLKAMFSQIPMLAQMVEGETAESITLGCRVVLEVHTASHRSVRGYTLAAVIAEELAFWRSEDSSSPDFEILDAVRPALATIPHAKLIGVSSPYRRAGALYDAWERHYGRASDVLVIQAPSRTMNPSLPVRVVNAALERDPAAARAEYLADWRDDVSGFLDPDAIQACVETGMKELAPNGRFSYRAFTDPSGGRADAFTLAIGHVADGRRIIDLARSRRPPFNPSEVVAEFCVILKTYGVAYVTGDRYAAQWVTEAFRKEGIDYRPAKSPASEIYLAVESLFNTRRVVIPDSKQLISELRSLERRTTKSGKDSVDHGPGGHDDLANSVAGCLWLLERRQPRPQIRSLGIGPSFRGLAGLGDRSDWQII